MAGSMAVGDEARLAPLPVPEPFEAIGTGSETVAMSILCCKKFVGGTMGVGGQISAGSSSYHARREISERLGRWVRTGTRRKRYWPKGPDEAKKKRERKKKLGLFPLGPPKISACALALHSPPSFRSL